MPNFYNGYGQNYQMPQYQYQQSYAQPQVQPSVPSPNSMTWVDGEVGAKACQYPQGWVGPYPVWDTNDQIIYVKSVNPYGIPNPLQKIHYWMEDQPQTQLLPSNMSGYGMSGNNSATNQTTDTTNYATKDDMNELKEELRNIKNDLFSRINQNGSMSGAVNNGMMNTPNNNDNRKGGNRNNNA